MRLRGVPRHDLLEGGENRRETEDRESRHLMQKGIFR